VWLFEQQLAMASLLFDIELWREYAQKSRAFSKAMTDPRSKQRLLAVAAGFDRIEENDVRHWRKCAEQTRAVSRAMNDPGTKERMLAIAAGFEHVGDLASKLKSTGETAGKTQRAKRWLWGPAA